MTRQELAEAQKLLVELDSLYAVQEKMRNPISKTMDPEQAIAAGEPSLTLVHVWGAVGNFPVFDVLIDVGEIPKLATLLDTRLRVVREQLADLGVDETLTKETP